MTYSEVFEKAKIALTKVTSIFRRDRFRVWYVFLFFLSLFLVSYMSIDKTASLDDHFFHIRFAATIAEKGWGAFSGFQSIYFSKMSIGHEYLVYYNFLFYLILIPFSFLNPLVLGLKLYGVMALAVSFTVIYWFLKKVSVRYPFLWTIIFYVVLAQSGWLVRFASARPFTLAPVLLVLMLYAVHTNRYKTSAVIAFLYFFWHTATFMFPLCLAIGYVVFELFYGKKFDKKKVWLPLMGTGTAVLLAYIISPGIVDYLRDVIFPVFFETAFGKTSGIVEGNEVYGRDFFTLLKTFYGLFSALFIFGSYEILLYIRTKKGTGIAEERVDPDIQPLRSMLFMASLVFLVLSTLSSRFIDYFPYFAILYVSIVATDVLRFVEIRGVTFRKAFIGGLLLVSGYLCVSLTLDFSTVIADGQSYLTSQMPAEWLNKNVDAGKIIFNSSWSSFPTLYYFTGDRFRYVNGLEPRFLYDLSHRLYWTWVHIGADGFYCAERECPELSELQKAVLKGEDAGKQDWYEQQGTRIADSIRRDFESDIVVVPIGQQYLLDVMDHSNRFHKEYLDKENSLYGVYRVLEEVK